MIQNNLQCKLVLSSHELKPVNYTVNIYLMGLAEAYLNLLL